MSGSLITGFSVVDAWFSAMPSSVRASCVDVSMYSHILAQIARRPTLLEVAFEQFVASSRVRPLDHEPYDAPTFDRQVRLGQIGESLTVAVGSARSP